MLNWGGTVPARNQGYAIRCSRNDTIVPDYQRSSCCKDFPTKHPSIYKKFLIFYLLPIYVRSVIICIIVFQLGSKDRKVFLTQRLF